MALSSNNPDWESSFSQILNRTKHNLNRINQRYAPATSDSILASHLVPPNNENSLLMDKYAKSNVDGGSLPTAKPRSSGADIDVYERLARLEEQQRASEHGASQRILTLEKSLASAMTTVDRATVDQKDMERTITQLQGRLTTVNGLVSAIQNDQDSKRNVISKMDSWVRQGEIWREDMDSKLDVISKLTKSLDRTRQEQRDTLTEHVTRYDLDQLRDKMTLVTQQSVAASLSAWHDKMEASVRNVERQVALLRIGRTDPKSAEEGGEHLLTADEVTAALANPLPSELLLKGTVANEVMQMETQLQEKLEARFNLFLKDQVDSSHKTLNSQLHRQLHNLCAEMGIDYPESATIGTTTETPLSKGEVDAFDAETARARENYRLRLLEARKKSDDEMNELMQSVETIRQSLDSLQDSVRVDNKQHHAEISHLERRVEECLAVAGNSLTSVSDRSSRLEDIVRESELNAQNQHTSLKEELLERLGDFSRDWNTERAGLDRRLLVNEKIAEDCLDRIKLSQSAVESYFKASADVKRFHRSAEMVLELQQQLKLLQENMRDTEQTVHQLEANSSTKNDHLELRERVSRMEPCVLEKCPDYFESTKKVLDLATVLQSKLDRVETITNHQNNDLITSLGKISQLEITTTQLHGLTTVATEDVRRLTQSVSELDSSSRKDINYLRDLTGSISSRVVSMEGKLSLMSKSYAADTVATGKTLTKLHSKCDDLQVQHGALQNSLAQLQWASETSRREGSDQCALLKAQLDVMQTAVGRLHPVAAAAAYSTSASTSASAASAASSAPASTNASGSSGTGAGAGDYKSPFDLVRVPDFTTADTSTGTGSVNASRNTSQQSIGEGDRLDLLDTAATVKDINTPPPKAQQQQQLQQQRQPTGAFLTEPSVSTPGDAPSRSSLSETATVPAKNAAAHSLSSSSRAAPVAVEQLEDGDDEDGSSRSRGSSEAMESSPSTGPPAGGITTAPMVAASQSVSVENSWDASTLDNSLVAAAAAEIDPSADHQQHQAQQHQNISASQIPQQSNFDISMPSYVSHINNSSSLAGGDDDEYDHDNTNQTSSFLTAADTGKGGGGGGGGGGGAAASAPAGAMTSSSSVEEEEEDEMQSMGRLSVSSGGSLGNINHTIDELIKHKDSVLLSANNSPERSRSSNSASVSHDHHQTNDSNDSNSADTGTGGGGGGGNSLSGARATGGSDSNASAATALSSSSQQAEMSASGDGSSVGAAAVLASAAAAAQAAEEEFKKSVQAAATVEDSFEEFGDSDADNNGSDSDSDPDSAGGGAEADKEDEEGRGETESINSQDVKSLVDAFDNDVSAEEAAAAEKAKQPQNIAQAAAEALGAMPDISAADDSQQSRDIDNSWDVTQQSEPNDSPPSVAAAAAAATVDSTIISASASSAAQSSGILSIPELSLNQSSSLQPQEQGVGQLSETARREMMDEWDDPSPEKPAPKPDADQPSADPTTATATAATAPTNQVEPEAEAEEEEEEEEEEAEEAPDAVGSTLRPQRSVPARVQVQLGADADASDTSSSTMGGDGAAGASISDTTVSSSSSSGSSSSSSNNEPTGASATASAASGASSVPSLPAATTATTSVAAPASAPTPQPVPKKGPAGTITATTTATATTPSAAVPAVDSSNDKTLSIKERLRLRQETNRQKKTTSMLVPSSAASEAASVDLSVASTSSSSSVLVRKPATATAGATMINTSTASAAATMINTSTASTASAATAGTAGDDSAVMEFESLDDSSDSR